MPHRSSTVALKSECALLVTLHPCARAHIDRFLLDNIKLGPTFYWRVRIRLAFYTSSRLPTSFIQCIFGGEYIIINKNEYCISVSSLSILPRAIKFSPASQIYPLTLISLSLVGVSATLSLSPSLFHWRRERSRK